MLPDSHPQRQLRIALGELGFFLGGDFARGLQLEIRGRERRLYRQLLQLVQAFAAAVEIRINRAHVFVDILPRFRVRDTALSRVQSRGARILINSLRNFLRLRGLLAAQRPRQRQGDLRALRIIL